MAVLQRHQNANDAAIATAERQRCGSWSRPTSAPELLAAIAWCAGIAFVGGTLTFRCYKRL
jgi:hypothetical protein